MKYIAINELDKFEFHDAQIERIEFKDSKMIWDVSAVNATTENSQNDFPKDMCIDNAQIFFENVTIESIAFLAYKITHANGSVTEVERRAVPNNECHAILENSTTDYCGIFRLENLSQNNGEAFIATFSIDSFSVGFYDLIFSFSKVTVQWNTYYGEAWYEDDKWKKQNPDNNRGTNMTIRPISPQEREPAIALIWDTFLEFEAPDYSVQGVETFHDFIFNEKLFENVEFFGAFEDNDLRGVIASRDERKHICCFFVLAAYQRQGIGRQLWEYLRDTSIASTITVNSSPFAVPVYHKLGFEDTNIEQLTDGMRYTPMCFTK